LAVTFRGVVTSKHPIPNPTKPRLSLRTKNLPLTCRRIPKPIRMRRRTTSKPLQKRRRATSTKLIRTCRRTTSKLLQMWRWTAVRPLRTCRRTTSKPRGTTRPWNLKQQVLLQRSSWRGKRTNFNSVLGESWLYYTLKIIMLPLLVLIVNIRCRHFFSFQ